jgi:hypothetical protein
MAILAEAWTVGRLNLACDSGIAPVHWVTT